MKKEYNLLFLLILIILSFSGFSKNTYKYYREVIMNDKFNLITNYEVKKKQSKRYNCYELKYNKHNQLVRIRYKRYGKLNLDNYFGVAQINVKQEEDGTIWRRYYDRNKKPIKDDLNGVHAFSIYYEEKTNTINVKCFNEKLQKIRDNLGVYNYIIHLDPEGNVKNLIYSDDKGKVLNSDAYKLTFEYDDRIEGEYEVTRYLSDKDGNILISEHDKVVRNKRTYDDYGHLIEERFYGELGEPVEEMYSKIAMIRWKYDRAGRLIEKTYHGADGDLKIHDEEKIAKVKYQYDAHGNKIEEKYYGTGRKMVLFNNYELFGYAMIRWKYNKKGMLEETQYYDERRKLIKVFNEKEKIRRMKKMSNPTESLEF